MQVKALLHTRCHLQHQSIQGCHQHGRLTTHLHHAPQAQYHDDSALLTAGTNPQTSGLGGEVTTDQELHRHTTQCVEYCGTEALWDDGNANCQDEPTDLRR